MGLFMQTGEPGGTRMVGESIPLSAASDPLQSLQLDVYEKVHVSSGPGTDSRLNGSIVRLAYKAGTVKRRSEWEALLKPPVIDSISPTTGATAGGTVVTVRGHNLDGVRTVTLGGAPVTGLTKVSEAEFRFTTPAGVAGLANLSVVGDQRNDQPVVKTGWFTYTA